MACSHRWINGHELEPDSGIHEADCASCDEKLRFGPGVEEPNFGIESFAIGVRAIVVTVKPHVADNQAARRILEEAGTALGKMLPLWAEFKRTIKK